MEKIAKFGKKELFIYKSTARGLQGYIIKTKENENFTNVIFNNPRDCKQEIYNISQRKNKKVEFYI